MNLREIEFCEDNIKMYGEAFFIYKLNNKISEKAMIKAHVQLARWLEVLEKKEMELFLSDELWEK